MNKIILTSDWHLRDNIPISRTDDYWKAQENKIDFILGLSKKYKAPILIAGDLFHKARSSQFLEQWTINKLKNYSVCIIPGQHDLLSHRIENLDKSSIGVLKSSGIAIMENPFGDIFIEKLKNKTIGMTHTFIESPDNPEDKIIEGTSAKKILEENSDCDIIVSGDNHIPFVVEYDNRFLVNPGSLMRTTAKQINHKPRVYLYDLNKHKVEPVYIPIEKDVISREHIEIEKQKNDRIESFINRVNMDYEIDLSFQENMKKFIAKNKIRRGVTDIIWEVLE